MVISEEQVYGRRWGDVSLLTIHYSPFTIHFSSCYNLSDHEECLSRRTVRLAPPRRGRDHLRGGSPGQIAPEPPAAGEARRRSQRARYPPRHCHRTAQTAPV